jgi:hypothetical protein
VEGGKWKGKGVPYSKAKERKSPKVEPNPRRKKMAIAGKSKLNATYAGQRDIGPVNVAPPGTWLTSTNRSRDGKGQHEFHFTTEPEAQKHDDMNVDTNGGDIQMEENKNNLLDEFDIFGDLQ